MSPEPRPCSAETGARLPQPEVPQAVAPRPRCAASSTLLAASTTGLPDARRIFTTASSASVMPTVASTTNSTASASVDRDLGLRGDPLGEAAGVGVPAAGVDDGERAAVPVGVVGHPVAGHAGHVLDDRLAAADDPVDQRRLADVGAADDGQHRDRSGRPRRGRRRVVGHVVAHLAPRRRARCRGRPRSVLRAAARAGRGRCVAARFVQCLPAAAPGAASRRPGPFPCVRGQGRASSVTAGRRTPRRCGHPAAAVESMPAARLAGAEDGSTGTTGRPGHQREVGRPVVEAVQLAVAARALGEDADHAARRAAPAAQSARRRGSAWNRSSGIWPGPRRNRPVPALGTSRAWSARAPAAGAKTASSGPSRTPMWLAAKITGPVAGHVLGAVHADVVAAPDAAPRATGPQPRAASAAAGGRRRRCAAARSWRSGSRRPLLCRLGERRRPGRSTSSRVYGVVSMWTASSAIVSGAVARPESIRSRASSDSWVAGARRRRRPRRRGARPGRRVGGEVDLDVGLRPHDGADVAALDDDPAVADDVALQLQQPGPDLGDGADRR